MKISVIIPTYNRPQLLRQCLDALMPQQLDRPFEVLVVSDGPDEQTANLLSGYDPHLLKHLALPEHKGPAAARNAGVAASTGDWIVFTDDDTIPQQGWLQKFADAFRTSGYQQVAFSGGVVVQRSERPTDFEANTAGLETSEFVTANCAISREAFECCGGFDEAFTMAWREDSDLHFKLLKHRIPVISLPQASVTHPVRKASWDVSIRAEKKNMFNALLFKKHPQLYRDKIGMMPKWNYYGMVLLALAAIAQAGTGNRRSACVSMTGWAVMAALFTARRLAGKSKSPEHVLQMMVTSAAIPFCSVFWKLYGSWRFKKLLL